MPLAPYYNSDLLEAGCDEAGRGCLAGPVFAAAVILSPDFRHDLLDDSKKLSETKRKILRPIIEKEAIAWQVVAISEQVIDEINILNASILGMQKAVTQLSLQPQLILVDGNRFKPLLGIPHQCIIKGDSKFQSIAAASILAKTHRDEYMEKIALEYPSYQWHKNKGYPTKAHKQALLENGMSPYHRMTFSWR